MVLQEVIVRGDGRHFSVLCLTACLGWVVWNYCSTCFWLGLVCLLTRLLFRGVPDQGVRWYGRHVALALVSCASF